MKRKLLFTGLVIATMPGSFLAQPVLNNTEMLPFGSAMTLSLADDYTLVDTVTQGQGVTWNMTSLSISPGSTDLVVTIVDPASTPYSLSFPTSNYAYSESPSSAYRYFDLSSTKMERIGSYSGGTLKTYNDPQVEYVFPMAYGIQNLDTWDNDVSTSGGTYDMFCIGDGTLNLPGGSYQALLVRVHAIESFVDFEVYFWYDADNGSILLQYVVGDGFWVGTFARYSTNLVLGNNELESLGDLKYNNPVVDQFKLTFQNTFGSALSYTIVDLNGRIMDQDVPKINGDNVSIDKDLSHLANGIYILTVSDPDKGKVLKSVRIVKQ